MIPALLEKWFNERVEMRKLVKKYHEQGDTEKEEYFEDLAFDQFFKLFHSMQPQHFNEKLEEQIQNYRGQTPIGDDITVMTIRLNF